MRDLVLVEETQALRAFFVYLVFDVVGWAFTSSDWRI